MTDDPTTGEVGRALEALRQQFRDDIETLRSDQRTFRTDTNARLDRTLPLDVYAADQRAERLRFDQLHDDLSELREARKEDAERIEHAKADRAANRKWLIASMIIPIGIAILEIYFAIRGVK